MTTHEERKRELVDKLYPGPWRYDSVKAELQTAENTWWTPTNDVIADACGPFIAFHDPTTALLEADVIEWARDLFTQGDFCDGDGGPASTGLRKALAALDAHHAKREAK